MTTLIKRLLDSQQPSYVVYDPKSEKHRKAFMELLLDFYQVEKPDAEVLSRFENPNVRFCCVGSNFVGLLSFKFPKNPPGTVYISTFSVHSTQRRKGYGLWLLNTFADEWKTHKEYNQLRLGVKANNSSAIALYKKAGFRVVNKGRDEGIDFFIMSKPL